MKILMIVTTPFVLEKGSSLRVLGIVKLLSKAGYRIDIVTYPVGKSPRLKGVRIFRPKIKYNKTSPGPSPAKILADIHIFRLARKLLLKNNYDIIQGEDSEGGFIACILSRKGKIVYDMHNKMSEQMVLHKWYALVPVAWLIERVLFSKPSLIITNWKRVLNQLGKYQKKAVLFYDPINLEEKKPLFSLPKNYAVYTGNFEKYQGVDLLLRSFWRAKPDFDLLLVGDHKKEILQGANGKVIFLGKLPVENTNYIIRNSLFCIIPRVHGKQPSMKIIHYLLNQKPVLATDIECNRELLSKDNALFVRPDEISFAKGLTRMGKHSRAVRVPAELQPELQSQNLLKAYSKLI